jgi:hypothetical protein
MFRKTAKNKAQLAGQTALLFVLLAMTQARADLIWEDHFSNNDTVSDGTVINTGGIDITIDTGVTGDPTAPRGQHFMYRDGPEGNHTGYLDLNLDTDEDNRNDQLCLDFTFGNGGAQDLQFSIIDIDSGSWDDGIEIQYTSITGGGDVRDDPSIYSLPTGTTTVFLDNEPNMHGFEGGAGNSGSANDWGTLGLDFTGQIVTSISIKFFSTDDAAADPGAQFIGITDFIFTSATPEPSAFILMLAGMGGLTYRRPNRRRCRV